MEFNDQEPNTGTMEERLATLLEKISSYIEYYHGGSVAFAGLENEKKLKVKFGGACEGCNLTMTTLQGWVGGTVKQFFPNIEEIVAVES